MRKWGRLARNLATTDAVPNVSNVPKLRDSPTFGTFGTFGTRHAEMDEAELTAALDERAAIMEYDGGVPRAEAERMARIEIEHLFGACK